MGPVSVHSVLSTIMAMSLIQFTCVFDVCLSSVEPQFTFSPSERPALGDTMTVTCSATGDFWSIVLKKKNAGEDVSQEIAEQTTKNSCRPTSKLANLRPGAYVSPCQNEWKLSVVIPDVTPDDSAEYTCDITMSDNSPNARASKTVTVLVPPSVPRITGNVTVIEGHRLALSCDGATTPGRQGYTVTTPVKYRWQKNNLFIQEAPSTGLVGYYVERARPQDGGLYRCIASNEADRSYSPQTKVEIYYLPKTVEIRTKKTSRLAGEIEEFRCTTSDANPTPTLRLMRVNGPSTFEVDSQVTVSLTKNLKLKPSDNGAEFYCEATSGAKIPNQKSTSRKLRYEVTFPPSELKMVATPNGMLEEHSVRTLQCETGTGSNPPSAITWFKVHQNEFVPLTGAEDTRFPDNYGSQGLKSRLVVKVSRHFNGATIECHLQFQGKTALVKAADMVVAFPPRQITTTSPLLEIVQENQRKVFTCTTDPSYPAADILWIKTLGAKTRQLFPLKIDRSPADYEGQITTSYVTVMTSRYENTAVYQCEVRYRGRLIGVSTRWTLGVMFAPFVTVNMTKGTVRENESTKVICNATGGNPSKIDSYQWEFRRPDSDVYTKLSDRSRELALPHVQYNEAGYYRCTATNAAGSQSHEERLYVKFSPRLDEAFKLQPQVAGEVGKSATFSLHLNSNPQPTTVEWFWSQGKISPSNTDFLMNEKTPYQISLRIPSVRVEHYGQFNCTVDNGIGEKTYSFKLMKAGPPLMPSSLAAADVTARSITLVWTSEFTGGSPQTFSIMYKKADDNWPSRDQITDIADPGYKQQVRHRITGLESDSWYTFRVRSTNTHPGNNQSPYAPLGAARTLELPKTEDLQAYRDGNEIEVSWRQPTGTYDGAKIEYCVEGTTTCRNHTVLDISQHTSTLTVEDGKTFIYKLHLLAKDDVLFTSPAFLAKLAPIRTSNIGFIAGGAGLFVLIIAIIIIFICCNRRKQHKKKKRETELHNSRALMQGAENPALNNTLTRSFNDLGGMTQHLDVANLRKQDLECLYENTKVTKPNQNGGQANMPGPDVVPNSDQPENEYANAMMAGIPVGQVEPMQRLPDKEYENLMVAARNKHPHIPDQPIQTVSPEGIVYTKVFYTMPNNNSRPMPQNNNDGDHYAKIDVNRTASQPRTQEPPPYHSRAQSPRPQSPEDQVDRSRPQSPPRSPLHLDESEHYLEDVV